MHDLKILFAIFISELKDEIGLRKRNFRNTRAS